MCPAVKALFENVPHVHLSNVGPQPELEQHAQQVFAQIVAHFCVLWHQDFGGFGELFPKKTIRDAQDDFEQDFPGLF